MRYIQHKRCRCIVLDEGEHECKFKTKNRFNEFVKSFKKKSLMFPTTSSSILRKEVTSKFKNIKFKNKKC